MAYPVSKGSSVSILHPVRDLAGTSLITGQAANLTYTITDPDGTQTTSGITWTEPNSDGWYLGAKTYSTLGVWHVAVSNAAISTSDQGTYDYYVQCIQDAAGATPSGTYLTTVANLKEILDITDSSQDALLLNLVARASQSVERALGRPLVQATYTELYDGPGSRSLNLRHGPIQSVTYVADVEWSNAGVKSTTAISAGDYFIRGKASEGWHLPGWLERRDSVWWKDQQNYEVSYSAGYSSVPYDLEQIVLELCVAYKNQRKDWGNVARDIGGGGITFRDFQSVWANAKDRLQPYMDMRYM